MANSLIVIPSNNRTNSSRPVDPVRVELDAGSLADWSDDHEVPPFGRHPTKLGRRSDVPVRVERLAVPAKSDMLDHVHARNRLELAVLERKRQQVPRTASEPVEGDPDRSVVVEIDRHER